MLIWNKIYLTVKATKLKNVINVFWNLFAGKQEELPDW